MFLLKILRAGAALGFLAAGTGCGPVPYASPAAAPVQPTGRGLVWRVSGGKVPCFLAGSLHILRPEDQPLPEPYNIAWRETSALVMELPDPGPTPAEAKALVARLAFLPEGQLRDRLRPATLTLLDQWTAQAGDTAAALEKMKPWMAGLAVAAAATAKLGFRQDLGVEDTFRQRLAAEPRPVEGLETMAGQLERLDQLPPATQDRMLEHSLIQAVRDAEEFPALVRSWREGRADDVQQHLAKSFAAFPEVARLLIEDRNAAWLPHIEARLQGHRATLILVGSGHLCGPGSLVDRLEKKGYRCTPVDPPSAVSALPKKAA